MTGKVVCTLIGGGLWLLLIGVVVAAIFKVRGDS
jgi:hypothetical protein